MLDQAAAHAFSDSDDEDGIYNDYMCRAFMPHSLPLLACCDVVSKSLPLVVQDGQEARQLRCCLILEATPVSVLLRSAWPARVPTGVQAGQGDGRVCPPRLHRGDAQPRLCDAPGGNLPAPFAGPAAAPPPAPSPQPVAARVRCAASTVFGLTSWGCARCVGILSSARSPVHALSGL